MVVIHIASWIMGGGVGSVVRTLLYEQYFQGYSLAVLTNERDKAAFVRWADSHDIRGIKFYAIEKYRTGRMTVWGGVSPATFKRIKEDFPNENIVFHYHNPIAIGVLSYIGDVRKVCTIHGMLMKQASRMSTRILLRMTFDRMKRYGVAIAGCSEKVKAHCMDIQRGRGEIYTVPNGVIDTKCGSNKYVSDAGKCIIGYASNIDELKGWRILAKAFDMLPEAERDKVQLIIAGGVAPESREEFSKWIEKHENVKYIGRISDVQECLLPFVDILVLPSRIEGMPMVVLEAMQAKTCIISTAVGGVPEIVKNGYNGFLVERTPGDVSKALVKLIDDPKLLNEMKDNARKLYEKQGTAKLMAERYSIIYKNQPETVKGEKC